MSIAEYSLRGVQFLAPHDPASRLKAAEALVSNISPSPDILPPLFCNATLLCPVCAGSVPRFRLFQTAENTAEYLRLLAGLKAGNATLPARNVSTVSPWTYNLQSLKFQEKLKQGLIMPLNSSLQSCQFTQVFGKQNITLSLN